MTCSLSVILLTGLLLIITTTGTILVNTAFGQFGGRFSGGFVPIEEKVLPTYVIRIPLDLLKKIAHNISSKYCYSCWYYTTTAAKSMVPLMVSPYAKFKMALKSKYDWLIIYCHINNFSFSHYF
jgi:hypothetical protein